MLSILVARGRLLASRSECRRSRRRAITPSRKKYDTSKKLTRAFYRITLQGAIKAMPLLNQHQLETFQRDGVLVVNNVLDAHQVQKALDGLKESLTAHSIDINNLRQTGHHLKALSSTNGSGGVLDIYYPPWKLDICTNQLLFDITTQLWEAAYCHHGESRDDVSPQDIYKYHPYGAFDVHRGYVYLDRIGFRLPTDLAVAIGADMTNRFDHKHKAWNKVAIQRSLTPHLDCCPSTFYTKQGKHKWRPIQCFISLTDTLQPNRGGFEAALGFHRDFYAWAATTTTATATATNTTTTTPTNTTTTTTTTTNSNTTTKRSFGPCLGEYTHIRPKEDLEIMQRIQHVVGVTKGSAVFWDNRIPHSNSYRHDGTEPRIVVYCSFLPDVEVNRAYVQRQLQDWKHGRIPGLMDKYGDRWIEASDFEDLVQEITWSLQYQHYIDDHDDDNNNNDDDSHLLARKLLGIVPWE